jgi:cyclohexanone monooxygenase
VSDPSVARLLEPRQVIGCKRLCIDSGYYETFNRPNVRLVDVSNAPIEAITPARVADRRPRVRARSASSARPGSTP